MLHKRWKSSLRFLTSKKLLTNSVLQEIFLEFFNFLRQEARSKIMLYDLFRKSWLDVYFNQIELPLEEFTYNTFKEFKKRTFIVSPCLIVKKRD